MLISLDFETRSVCNLKKAGAWKYSRHDTTEPLCLQWAMDDHEIELWQSGHRMPNSLSFALEDPDCLVEAHNVEFERAIWENIMVARFGWSSIFPWQWRCTAARAAAYGLPRSLDDVGVALNLEHKKDQSGKRIMMKLARPKKTKDGSLAWHDKPEEFKTLYEYCKGDVECERELSHTIPQLPPRELKIWQLDQKVNHRGVRVDVNAVDAALDFLKLQQVKDTARLADLTCGEIKSLGQVAKIRDFIYGKYKIKLPNMTKETVAAALNQGVPADVRGVLELRQNGAKSSVKKFEAIKTVVDSDDRLRGLLLYYGASTGRWAGKLVQPQNLKRNKIGWELSLFFSLLKKMDPTLLSFCYPDDAMEKLSQCVRGLFIPSDDCTFYGGDFSAIEARVMMWLADEKKALRMYREGIDLYVDLAKIIFGTKHITDDQRTMGKVGLLGGIYQMGGERLQGACLDQAGLKIEREQASYIIATIRNTYRHVPKFWELMDNAAMMAVKTGKRIKTTRKDIWWQVQKGVLVCRLPSGRLLRYQSPSIKPTKTPWGTTRLSLHYYAQDSKTKRWQETHTYGGKLTENIVQAVARDMIAEAMLRVEAAGYNVLLTIHDELLTERSTGRGYLDEFESLTTELPDWANGLPMAAKVWKGHRYLK